ncbi:MAG: signal recognition particle-docking protein FtsY [Motiliproteus sp.]
MNELIQTLTGPEILPYVMGALALIVVLVGGLWLTRSESEPTEQADARADKVAAAGVVAERVIEAGAVEPSAGIKPEPEPKPEPKPEPEPEPEAPVEAPEQRKARLFQRIKQGLGRTKANFAGGLADLFRLAKEVDDDLFEEIETQLLLADVGVEATSEIIKSLTARVERNQLGDADALYQALQQELAGLLSEHSGALQVDASKQPYVILVVGVNGVGKTTTIGKMAKRFQAEGKSVMLAAGDTFRAAAVEQLQVWGERNNVPVVAQHTGADSASVIFDAVQSAKAKGVDVVIADTAGRLQNKAHLMGELEKVVRVMRKLDDSAPHEVMLVLDAGTGQNAISQATLFTEAVGVTGITLTKLDGTAKGGVIFAIAKQLDIPIRFIGVGEQIDDLRPFVAQEFIQALFDQD